MRLAALCAGCAVILASCITGSGPGTREPAAPQPAAPQPAARISTAAPQVPPQKPRSLLEEYEALNAAESRAREWQDSPSTLALKLQQVDYINADRARFGAGPVKLDILASRVANRMAQEGAREGFHGHYNLRGEKPYQRYAFAGGQDHIAENASAMAGSEPLPTGLSDQAAMMRRLHDAFMAERAPNDGHKQNCIAPQHNFVGLGVAEDGRQFRYYEEFVDRYLAFDSVPESVSPDREFTISVRALSQPWYVYAVVAYYEPFPRPMTAAQANSYSYYLDYSGTQAMALWPWELAKHRAGAGYVVPVKFSSRGLYYVKFYVSDTPYSTGSATTEGKREASGLVITVR
jgi:uncharacterized protein YkwD